MLVFITRLCIFRGCVCGTSFPTRSSTPCTWTVDTGQSPRPLRLPGTSEWPPGAAAGKGTSAMALLCTEARSFICQFMNSVCLRHCVYTLRWCHHTNKPGASQAARPMQVMKRLSPKQYFLVSPAGRSCGYLISKLHYGWHQTWDLGAHLPCPTAEFCFSLISHPRNLRGTTFPKQQSKWRHSTEFTETWVVVHARRWWRRLSHQVFTVVHDLVL